jgi:hypothetical protein
MRGRIGAWSWCFVVAAMALDSFIPVVGLGAEIPQPIRRAYLMGARTVESATDPARISFSGTDWFGHYQSPYVRVSVNGRGPFTFLFDTGSSTTILSTKVVKAASVQIVSSVPGHHAIARATEIRVGDIIMRDYYTVVADGNDVDGILGFNAFGKKYLTFDFARRALIVSSRSLPLPAAFWLTYAPIKHIPVIDLFADGVRLPTLIDTGDDAYAWEGTSRDLEGLTFDHPPVPAATVFNGETGATDTTITSVDGSLSLGPWHSNRPAVAVNESLPLPDIGMDVIDQFALEFDRVHQRVGFQPHFSGSQFAVPGRWTTGFYISFHTPVRFVRGVLPNWPPARAGMRAGDVVTTIDGTSASATTYQTWDRLLRAGRPIAITWKHESQTFSRTFPVVELR